MGKQSDSAENDLPPSSPVEASGMHSSEEHLDDETTRGGQRERHTSADDGKPSSPSARKPRARGTRASRGGQRKSTPDEGVLHLPERGKLPMAERDDETVAVAELEAQGFTPDEAIRLIHVSGQIATSHEAREAEATLRRLRFTRWLIERGVLDEFSA